MSKTDINAILSLLTPEVAAQVRATIKEANVKELNPKYSVSVKGCISVKGLNPFVTNFMPYVAEAIVNNPEILLSLLREALPDAVKAREAWESMSQSDRDTFDSEQKRKYNAA